MTLKIAHVTASPNFGGVERIILETARAHRQKGTEQVLATFPEEMRKCGS